MLELAAVLAAVVVVASIVSAEMSKVGRFHFHWVHLAVSSWQKVQLVADFPTTCFSTGKVASGSLSVSSFGLVLAAAMVVVALIVAAEMLKVGRFHPHRLHLADYSLPSVHLVADFPTRTFSVFQVACFACRKFAHVSLSIS